MMMKKKMTATITLAQTAVRISKNAECLAKSPASNAGLFDFEIYLASDTDGNWIRDSSFIQRFWSTDFNSSV